MIRPARERDLRAVHDLDRRCSPVFESMDSYASLLRGDRGLLLVAYRDDASLCGVAAWSLVLDEATLLNLVVAFPDRQRGTGRRLLRCSGETLAARGIRRLLLEVRESNRAAQALYRAEGFRLDGRRRAYYASRDGSPREDALLMSLEPEVVLEDS